MDQLTHLDEQGRLCMVDVGDKPTTRRRAVAAATLVVGPAVAQLLREGKTPKGNALEAARLAGVLAAKRTFELIPLCHQVVLDHVEVDCSVEEDRVHIRAEASAWGKTGVEMEALTAAAVAGLTLYDMLKALGRGMVLQEVRLLRKEGGRTGVWTAEGFHDR
ncbi:MAG: cyclic pyranopterin monophosphate synthase MoaC [Thermoanaerobaculum sp.]|nr:cyclic pyranopterin monophosphate synthase MoaC [Thermoanaerobaculum sp.]MCX7895241.1 cyclic pyranopterin monophosphate synthase MoaC [Thermoanaerobaculum sp.]MDW7968578.1 cyclic pyranopterin monophosphate synthase MoaC [Thermoanaerobaculum sp.]